MEGRNQEGWEDMSGAAMSHLAYTTLENRVKRRIREAAAAGHGYVDIHADDGPLRRHVARTLTEQGFRCGTGNWRHMTVTWAE